MRYFLLLLSVAVVFIASCEKVDVPQSKEDKLRAGKWRTSEIRKKSRLIDNKFYVDTIKTESLDACKQDDYLEFAVNNQGTLKTGEKKCQDQVEQLSFRWGITDNDTKMYLYEAGEMFDGNNNITADLTNFADNTFTLDYMTFANTFIKVGDKSTLKIDTTWYTAIVRKS